MGLFRNKSEEIFSPDELEDLSNNHQYFRNKKIEDAFNGSLAIMIWSIPFILLGIAAFIFWYYMFRINKPSELFPIIGAVTTYFAGIFTPKIKSALNVKSSSEK